MQNPRPCNPSITPKAKWEISQSNTTGTVYIFLNMYTPKHQSTKFNQKCNSHDVSINASFNWHDIVKLYLLLCKQNVHDSEVRVYQNPRLHNPLSTRHNQTLLAHAMLKLKKAQKCIIYILCHASCLNLCIYQIC